MADRTLHVTIVSAEDLKAWLFCKVQPYAVVWIDRHKRLATGVDKDGRANPIWNERLSFSVPEHLLQHPGSSLHIDIYSKASLVWSRVLGSAVIPLQELAQQSDAKEISMYQLRRRSGRVKGAVRLSVHLDEKAAEPLGTGYGGPSQPAMAYQQSGQKPGYGGYPQGYPPQQPYPPYPPQGYYPPQQGYYQQPYR